MNIQGFDAGKFGRLGFWQLLSVEKGEVYGYKQETYRSKGRRRDDRQVLACGAVATEIPKDLYFWGARSYLQLAHDAMEGLVNFRFWSAWDLSLISASGFFPGISNDFSEPRML